jgi:hypothetical protein
MARKLTLRERALSELGDFARDVPEDGVREKMAAIYERDALESGEDDTSIALHKAVIMRDGNLDAFEVKPKKPALDEKTEKDIQAAAHSFAVGYAAMRAEAGKTEKPAAVSSGKAARKDSPKIGEKSKAPDPIFEEPELEPMQEPEPEKRKRGRPHKHKAEGGQFSVWIPSETKKRLQVRAASEGISAGELAARFIEAGLLKRGD